jgi:TP901 family phage tail tape measure protein
MADIRVRVAGETTQLQKDIKRALKGGYSLGSLDGKGVSQPLGKIKGQLGEFDKSMEAANARVIAFGASTGAIYAVATAIQHMVKSAIEVEKALTDINVILGATSTNLEKFGNSLFAIASATGQSFKTIAEAASELARQGLGVEESLGRVRDAMILARISGLDAADAVSSLTAVLNGFTKAAYESNEVVNKIVAVDAAFAVSAADLAEAIKRVGSTAAEAGVSLEELLAITAATQQVTARGGAVIGNAFKTIFTRMQRPRVIEALKAVGVETKNASGSSLGLMKVLENMAKSYDKMNSAQKSVVAEMVGGVFQVNILKAALGDLSKETSLYGQALKIANSATTEANDRNNELNQTISSQLIKTMNNLVRVGAKVGELTFGPALEKSLAGVNSILGKAGDKDGGGESIGKKLAKGLLSGIGSVISGPGIAFITLGIMKLFQKLVSFASDAMGSMSGLNSKSKETAAIQSQVLQYLQKNPAVIAGINAGLVTEKQLHSDILSMLRRQNDELDEQEKVANRIAQKMQRSGARVSTATGAREGTIRGGGAAIGYVPNLSEKKYEETRARQLGAPPSVQAKHYPQGKIKGKPFTANDQEDVLSPRQMQKQYGVTPQKGEYTVLPKYGKVGQQRKKELKQKIEKAQKPINFSGGFVPNFITENDVEKFKKSTFNKRKFGKKRGAVKTQGTKPTAGQMLGYMNQNINQIDDAELKTYIDLNRQGKILLNWPRGGGKPSEQTQARISQMSGGKAGTSKKAGRTKEERGAGLSAADIEGPILPVLKLQTGGETAEIGQRTAGFGLKIKNVEKDFNKHFNAEYGKLVGNMGAKMFQGKPELQKAFKPQKLAADAQGQVKGHVWESFVRGMMQEEKAVVSKRVDVSKGTKVRPEFQSLFPKQLHKGGFEIRAGGISGPDAVGKMEESGISTTFKKLGAGYTTTKGGRRKLSHKEARELYEYEHGEKPSFAPAHDMAKGTSSAVDFGSKKKGGIRRMVLDSDFLKQHYAKMGPEAAQQSMSAQLDGDPKPNIKKLFDKIATQAQQKGKRTTLVNAAPGAGKTSFAMGKKGTQITSIGDLDRGSKLVILRAVERGENLVKEPYFNKADRVMHLDVPPEEIDRRRAQRDKSIRAGTSKTAYGRPVGSTEFAGKDFSAAEARVAEEFSGTSGKFKSLQAGKEKWRMKGASEIEKIHDTPMVMTAGAFSPPHKGHGTIFKKMLKDAEKTGAVPIAAVSKGEGRTGDVGLTIREKRKLIETEYPEMQTMGISGFGGIPEVMRGPDGRLIRAKAGKSKVILGSDRVSDSVGAGFRKKGMEVEGVARDLNSKGMDATDAISATKVRSAILGGRVGEAKQALDPRIGEILTRPENVNRMNKRAAVIAEKKQKEKGINTLVDAEFRNLTKIAVNKGIRGAGEKPISRLVGPVTKSDDPEVIASIGRIKDLRENEKTRIKKDYDHRVAQMARDNPMSMGSGYIPNFAIMRKYSKGKNVMSFDGTIDDIVTSIESGGPELKKIIENANKSLVSTREGKGTKKAPGPFAHVEDTSYGSLAPIEKTDKFTSRTKFVKITPKEIKAFQDRHHPEKFPDNVAAEFVMAEKYGGFVTGKDQYHGGSAAEAKRQKIRGIGESQKRTVKQRPNKRSTGEGALGDKYSQDILFPKGGDTHGLGAVSADTKWKDNISAPNKGKGLGKPKIEEFYGATIGKHARDSLSRGLVDRQFKEAKQTRVDKIDFGLGLMGTKEKALKKLPGSSPKKKAARSSGRKSEGYIPNFAKKRTGGIKAAIEREESAGHKAKVLYSDRLQSPVVVNEKQVKKHGPNADAIIRGDHVNQGQGGSKTNLMKSGSGKEMYDDGFVPNFMGGGGFMGSMGLGMFGFIAQFDSLKRSLDPVQKELHKTSKELGRWQIDLDKLDRSLEKTRGELHELGAENVKLKDVGGGKYETEDPRLAGVLSSANMPALQTEADRIRGGASGPGAEKAAMEQAVTEARTAELQAQEGRDVGERGRKETQLTGGQDKVEALEKRAQAEEEFKNKLSAGAMAVGMAMSVAAGMIQDETSRWKKGMEAAGQGAQMAATAMFMIPGPIGLSIGAVLGIATAARGIFHAMTDVGPKLKKAFEQGREELTKFSNGIQKYTQLYQKNMQAHEDPNTSAQTLIRLNRQMAEALMDVPLAYRAQIASAKNMTQMQEEMANALAEKTRSVQQMEVSAKIGQKLDDSRGMLPDTGQDLMRWIGLKKLGQTIGMVDKEPYNPKTRGGRMEAKAVANKLLTSLSETQLDTVMNFQEQVIDNDDNRRALPGSGKETTAALRLSGELMRDVSSIEELVDVLEDMRKNGAAVSMIMARVSAGAARMKEQLEVEKDLSRIRGEQKHWNEQLSDSLKASVNSYNQAKSAYAQFLQLIGKKMAFREKMIQERGSKFGKIGGRTAREIKYKEVELDMKRLAPFMSAGDASRKKEQLAMVRMLDKNAKSIEAVLTPVASDMGAIVQKQVASVKLQAKQLETGTPGAGGSKDKWVAATKKVKKALDLQEMVFFQEREEIGKGFTPEQIYQRRENLMASPLAKEVLGGGKISQIMTDLGTKVMVTNQKLSEMKIEQLKQLKAMLHGNIVAERMRQDKVDLKTMGGIEAFLNPSAFKPLEQAYNKSLTNLSRGREYGSQETRGRGAMQYLLSMKQMTGGSLDAKSPMVERYRREAISGKMTDEANKWRSLADREFQEAGRAPVGSRDRSDRLAAADYAMGRSEDVEGLTRTATKQVDAKLKLDNTIIGNLQDMNSWLKQIKEVLDLKTTENDRILSRALEKTTAGPDAERVDRQVFNFRQQIKMQQQQAEDIASTKEHINNIFAVMKKVAVASKGEYDTEDMEDSFTMQGMNNFFNQAKYVQPYERNEKGQFYSTKTKGFEDNVALKDRKQIAGNPLVKAMALIKKQMGDIQERTTGKRGENWTKGDVGMQKRYGARGKVTGREYVARHEGGDREAYRRLTSELILIKGMMKSSDIADTFTDTMKGGANRMVAEQALRVQSGVDQHGKPLPEGGGGYGQSSKEAPQVTPRGVPIYSGGAEDRKVDAQVDAAYDAGHRWDVVSGGEPEGFRDFQRIGMENAKLTSDPICECIRALGNKFADYGGNYKMSGVEKNQPFPKDVGAAFPTGPGLPQTLPLVPMVAAATTGIPAIVRAISTGWNKVKQGWDKATKSRFAQEIKSRAARFKEAGGFKGAGKRFAAAYRSPETYKGAERKTLTRAGLKQLAGGQQQLEMFSKTGGQGQYLGEEPTYRMDKNTLSQRAGGFLGRNLPKFMGGQGFAGDAVKWREGGGMGRLKDKGAEAVSKIRASMEPLLQKYADFSGRAPERREEVGKSLKKLLQKYADFSGRAPERRAAVGKGFKDFWEGMKGQKFETTPSKFGHDPGRAQRAGIKTFDALLKIMNKISGGTTDLVTLQQKGLNTSKAGWANMKAWNTVMGAIKAIPNIFVGAVQGLAGGGEGWRSGGFGGKSGAWSEKGIDKLIRGISKGVGYVVGAVPRAIIKGIWKAMPLELVPPTAPETAKAIEAAKVKAMPRTGIGGGISDAIAEKSGASGETKASRGKLKWNFGKGALGSLGEFADIGQMRTRFSGADAEKTWQAKVAKRQTAYEKGGKARLQAKMTVAGKGEIAPVQVPIKAGAKERWMRANARDGRVGGMGSQRGVGSGGGVVRHWIDAARRQVFGREMGGLGKGHRQNLALSEEGGKLGAGKTFTDRFTGKGGTEIQRGTIGKWLTSPLKSASAAWKGEGWAGAGRGSLYDRTAERVKGWHGAKMEGAQGPGALAGAKRAGLTGLGYAGRGIDATRSFMQKPLPSLGGRMAMTYGIGKAISGVTSAAAGDPHRDMADKKGFWEKGLSRNLLGSFTKTGRKEKGHLENLSGGLIDTTSWTHQGRTGESGSTDFRWRGKEAVDATLINTVAAGIFRNLSGEMGASQFAKQYATNAAGQVPVYSQGYSHAMDATSNTGKFFGTKTTGYLADTSAKGVRGALGKGIEGLGKLLDKVTGASSRAIINPPIRSTGQGFSIGQTGKAATTSAPLGAANLLKGGLIHVVGSALGDFIRAQAGEFEGGGAADIGGFMTKVGAAAYGGTVATGGNFVGGAISGIIEAGFEFKQIGNDVGALNDQMNELGNLYGSTANQYRTHFNSWASDMTMSGKHMKKFGDTFKAIGEWKATQQETMGATARESRPGVGSFIWDAVTLGGREGSTDKKIYEATSGAREKEAAALEVLRKKVLQLARDLGRTKDGIVKFAKITNVAGELVTNAYKMDIRTAGGGGLQQMSDRLLKDAVAGRGIKERETARQDAIDKHKRSKSIGLSVAGQFGQGSFGGAITDENAQIKMARAVALGKLAKKEELAVSKVPSRYQPEARRQSEARMKQIAPQSFAKWEEGGKKNAFSVFLKEGRDALTKTQGSKPSPMDRAKTGRQQSEFGSFYAYEEMFKQSSDQSSQRGQGVMIGIMTRQLHELRMIREINDGWSRASGTSGVPKRATFIKTKPEEHQRTAYAGKTAGIQIVTAMNNAVAQQQAAQGRPYQQPAQNRPWPQRPAQPGAAQPAQPGTARPGTARPGTARPGTAQPAQSGAPQPGPTDSSAVDAARYAAGAPPLNSPTAPPPPALFGMSQVGGVNIYAQNTQATSDHYRDLAGAGRRAGPGPRQLAQYKNDGWDGTGSGAHWAGEPGAMGTPNRGSTVVLVEQRSRAMQPGADINQAPYASGGTPPADAASSIISDGQRMVLQAVAAARAAMEELERMKQPAESPYGDTMGDPTDIAAQTKIVKTLKDKVISLGGKIGAVVGRKKAEDAAPDALKGPAGAVGEVAGRAQGAATTKQFIDAISGISLGDQMIATAIVSGFQALVTAAKDPSKAGDVSGLGNIIKDFLTRSQVSNFSGGSGRAGSPPTTETPEAPTPAKPVVPTLAKKPVVPTPAKQAPSPNTLPTDKVDPDTGLPSSAANAIPNADFMDSRARAQGVDPTTGLPTAGISQLGVDPLTGLPTGGGPGGGGGSGSGGGYGGGGATLDTGVQAALSATPVTGDPTSLPVGAFAPGTALQDMGGSRPLKTDPMWSKGLAPNWAKAEENKDAINQRPIPVGMTKFNAMGEDVPLRELTAFEAGGIQGLENRDVKLRIGQGKLATTPDQRQGLTRAIATGMQRPVDEGGFGMTAVRHSYVGGQEAVPGVAMSAGTLGARHGVPYGGAYSGSKSSKVAGGVATTRIISASEGKVKEAKERLEKARKARSNYKGKKGLNEPKWVELDKKFAEAQYELEALQAGGETETSQERNVGVAAKTSAQPSQPAFRRKIPTQGGAGYTSTGTYEFRHEKKTDEEARRLLGEQAAVAGGERQANYSTTPGVRRVKPGSQIISQLKPIEHAGVPIDNSKMTEGHFDKGMFFGPYADQSYNPNAQIGTSGSNAQEELTTLRGKLEGPNALGKNEYAILASEETGQEKIQGPKGTRGKIDAVLRNMTVGDLYRGTQAETVNKRSGRPQSPQQRIKFGGKAANLETSKGTMASWDEFSTGMEQIRYSLGGEIDPFNMAEQTPGLGGKRLSDVARAEGELLYTNKRKVDGKTQVTGREGAGRLYARQGRYELGKSGFNQNTGEGIYGTGILAQQSAFMQGPLRAQTGIFGQAMERYRGGGAALTEQEFAGGPKSQFQKQLFQIKSAQVGTFDRGQGKQGDFSPGGIAAYGKKGMRSQLKRELDKDGKTERWMFRGKEVKRGSDLARRISTGTQSTLGYRTENDAKTKLGLKKDGGTYDSSKRYSLQGQAEYAAEQYRSAKDDKGRERAKRLAPKGLDLWNEDSAYRKGLDKLQQEGLTTEGLGAGDISQYGRRFRRDNEGNLQRKAQEDTKGFVVNERIAQKFEEKKISNERAGTVIPGGKRTEDQLRTAGREEMLGLEPGQLTAEQKKQIETQRRARPEEGLTDAQRTKLQSQRTAKRTTQRAALTDKTASSYAGTTGGEAEFKRISANYNKLMEARGGEKLSDAELKDFLAGETKGALQPPDERRGNLRIRSEKVGQGAAWVEAGGDPSKLHRAQVEAEKHQAEVERAPETTYVGSSRGVYKLSGEGERKRRIEEAENEKIAAQEELVAHRAPTTDRFGGQEAAETLQANLRNIWRVGSEGFSNAMPTALQQFAASGAFSVDEQKNLATAATRADAQGTFGLPIFGEGDTGGGLTGESFAKALKDSAHEKKKIRLSEKQLDKLNQIIDALRTGSPEEQATGDRLEAVANAITERGTLGGGRAGAGQAGGFVPNFSRAAEEANMPAGAKAYYDGSVQINGQKGAWLNTSEKVFRGVGKNGDSAVLNEKMMRAAANAADGFVPNFAGGMSLAQKATEKPEDRKARISKEKRLNLRLAGAAKERKPEKKPWYKFWSEGFVPNFGGWWSDMKTGGSMLVGLATGGALGDSSAENDLAGADASNFKRGEMTRRSTLQNWNAGATGAKYLGDGAQGALTIATGGASASIVAGAKAVSTKAVGKLTTSYAAAGKGGQAIARNAGNIDNTISVVSSGTPALYASRAGGFVPNFQPRGGRRNPFAAVMATPQVGTTSGPATIAAPGRRGGGRQTSLGPAPIAAPGRRGGGRPQPRVGARPQSGRSSDSASTTVREPTAKDIADLQQEERNFQAARALAARRAPEIAAAHKAYLEAKGTIYEKGRLRLRDELIKEIWGAGSTIATPTAPAAPAPRDPTPEEITAAVEEERAFQKAEAVAKAKQQVKIAKEAAEKKRAKALAEHRGYDRETGGTRKLEVSLNDKYGNIYTNKSAKTGQRFTAFSPDGKAIGMYEVVPSVGEGFNEKTGKGTSRLQAVQGLGKGPGTLPPGTILRNINRMAEESQEKSAGKTEGATWRSDKLQETKPVLAAKHIPTPAAPALAAPALATVATPADESKADRKKRKQGRRKKRAEKKAGQNIPPSTAPLVPTKSPPESGHVMNYDPKSGSYLITNGSLGDVGQIIGPDGKVLGEITVTGEHSKRKEGNLMTVATSTMPPGTDPTGSIVRWGKKEAKYSGFVPNFSTGLERAIKAENKATGGQAEVRTSPTLHVAARGQEKWPFAKSHPEGIQAAIANSKATQIPNFAPPAKPDGATTALAKVEKDLADKIKRLTNTLSTTGERLLPVGDGLSQLATIEKGQIKAVQKSTNAYQKAVRNKASAVDIATAFKNAQKAQTELSRTQTDITSIKEIKRLEKIDKKSGQAKITGATTIQGVSAQRGLKGTVIDPTRARAKPKAGPTKTGGWQNIVPGAGAGSGGGASGIPGVVGRAHSASAALGRRHPRPAPTGTTYSDPSGVRITRPSVTGPTPAATGAVTPPTGTPTFTTAPPTIRPAAAPAPPARAAPLEDPRSFKGKMQRIRLQKQAEKDAQAAANRASRGPGGPAAPAPPTGMGGPPGGQVQREDQEVDYEVEQSTENLLNIKTTIEQLTAQAKQDRSDMGAGKAGASARFAQTQAELTKAIEEREKAWRKDEKLKSPEAKKARTLKKRLGKHAKPLTFERTGEDTEGASAMMQPAFGDPLGSRFNTAGGGEGVGQQQTYNLGDGRTINLGAGGLSSAAALAMVPGMATGSTSGPRGGAPGVSATTSSTTTGMPPGVSATTSSAATGIPALTGQAAMVQGLPADTSDQRETRERALRATYPDRDPVRAGGETGNAEGDGERIVKAMTDAINASFATSIPKFADAMSAKIGEIFSTNNKPETGGDAETPTEFVSTGGDEGAISGTIKHDLGELDGHFTMEIGGKLEGVGLSAEEINNLIIAKIGEEFEKLGIEYTAAPPTNIQNV